MTPLMTSTDKNLVVILGPTGVGKTELCLSLAGLFHSPVISADSRQMYADIPIGTAAPTESQRKQVRHYFVGTLGLDEYYSAARYEEDAMRLISELFQTHDTLIVAGGSMMYIDALCKGIDDIPTITPEVRSQIMLQYGEKGLDGMFSLLEELDPEYSRIVDRHNPKRVLHALEVCRMTGGTYTSLRRGSAKSRPFNIIKIGLTRPREELYERIGQRVDRMISEGLIEEARRVLPLRGQNSLNTVGYKELFLYFDHEDGLSDNGYTLPFAVEQIKRNTRVYSRKQMTWFKRDTSISWFSPDDREQIIAHIDSRIRKQ